MKRSDKFRQANREAKATFIAALAVIIFWVIAGFGLADVNISIYHTPLWVWGGCVGSWFFAIAITWYLIKFVFKDFDLGHEDEEEVHHG